MDVAFCENNTSMLFSKSLNIKIIYFPDDAFQVKLDEWGYQNTMRRLGLIAGRLFTYPPARWKLYGIYFSALPPCLFIYPGVA